MNQKLKNLSNKMSIGDITNKAKQTTPKQFFGVLGIAFLLWIVGSMLFCNGSCKKAKTCKKGSIEQGIDATKRVGEEAVDIVKGAGNAVENAAKSTRQSIFGRTATVEKTAVEEKTTNAVATPATATTTEKTVVATSNPTATTTTAAPETKQVVTEEIIKKKIIVEVEFQTPNGTVLGSKDVAVDEAATAIAKETVVETKTTETAATTTPAKTDSPIDAKIEQLQKEIEKLNAAKALLEDLR